MRRFGVLASTAVLVQPTRQPKIHAHSARAETLRSAVLNAFLCSSIATAAGC